MKLLLSSPRATALLITTFAVILTLLVIAGVVKGKSGNPIWYQSPAERDASIGSPFESSGTSSRYALVESLAEHGSVNLNLEQAQFAAPDIVEINGKFVTTFTPGISFAAVPFYLLGKVLGLPQLFAFFSTLLFAFVNAGLIYYLAHKLAKSHFAAMIASVVFLVATNSLIYGNSLTQHHGSTAVLLAAVTATTVKNKMMRNTLIGCLTGIGLLFDIPNVFMIMPVVLSVLFSHFRTVTTLTRKSFVIDFKFIFLALGLAPMIAVFLWYNVVAAGSPLVVAQMFGRSHYFDTTEQKGLYLSQLKDVDPYAEKYPLSTRQQLRSLSILLISNERSWLYYSPVLLLGIYGIYLLFKLPRKQKNLGLLVMYIATVNILVYSMFGDPWGGWSFGPRYLIPSAAMMSVLLAIALERWKRNIPFLLFFAMLFLYSLYISLAGALTTAAIPPKIEAEQLTTGIPYTYQYNFNFLNANQTSSLLFDLWFDKFISAKNYWYILTAGGSFALMLLLLGLWKEEKHV
ncbi:MAG: hypothetical protein COY81_03575 [Candidatus Pacebacteria bacterium CG_4_10_14_0_8_um_filter_43_12]|nr:MAG: hypothetical protein COY81_03575 [Candidatus Pacebacteria bacterium CG_4_10_14_0_8_um_filter_43_12]